MKLLKTCCCSCGCSLRTGSLITGSISLLISSLVFIAIICLKLGYSHYPEQRLLLINAFPIKLLLSLLLAVYAVIASICLLIGAAKAWKNWMIPWKVSTPIGIVMAIPCMLFSMIEFSENEHGPTGLVLLFMIFFLCGIALHIYLVLVVYSHYHELKGNLNESRTHVETSKPWSSCQMNIFPTVPEEV